MTAGHETLGVVRDEETPRGRPFATDNGEACLIVGSMVSNVPVCRLDSALEIGVRLLRGLHDEPMPAKDWVEQQLLAHGRHIRGHEAIREILRLREENRQLRALIGGGK